VVERSDAKSGIAKRLRRLIDQRDERRSDGPAQSAVLAHDGGRHQVGIVDLSASGAMIRHRGTLAEGSDVILHLLDHGAVKGQVRWVRDGCVGVSFTDPIGPVHDR
jgi:hypothetical protein